MRTPLPVACFIASLSLCRAVETPKEYPVPPAYADSAEKKDARMAWFREARFGMFIHWGLYSQLAGEWRDKHVTGGAEWIQKYLAIPSSQYSPLVKTFTGAQFDADAWVKAIAGAGIRYICVTTKHHDGFCLWPTQYNDGWNIAATPFGRDPLKELSAACKRHGVTFCIYHSILDWHHADWPGRPPYNDYAKGAPDKEKFRDYLYGQLEELFTNYGPIGMIWLDGSWDRNHWNSDDGKQLEDFIRTLQPSVVINNRSGYLPPQPKLAIEIKNEYSYVFAGDYISPEGEVPATGLPGVDWETCQTMQLPNNWGYSRIVGFRTYVDLQRQLIDVASKGGNLLLNIGPTGEGAITPQALGCLQKFGAWMKVNGEAIHGTTASPFPELPFNGRCTQKPGKLFLHVFDWPADGKLSVPMANEVKRAVLLADPARPLAATRTSRGARIALPAQAPDPVASVIALEIEGPAQPVAVAANLAQGRPVEASAEWPGRDSLVKENAVDGKMATIWAGPENSREGWLVVNLGEEKTVTAALLSEGPEYHRASAFLIEAEVGGAWREVARGTKIGARREVDLEPAKASRFRLRVRTGVTPGAADGEPVVAEFQLFP